jgi:hypothetical protein
MILIRHRSHFYHDHRSLQTPSNNVLVLLTSILIRDMIGEVLVEWVMSVHGWSLYERIIKDIQASQPKEQLVLNLAALLCYHRLLLTPDTDQPIRGSYQADFDAILNGDHLGNAQSIFEHMTLSVLRVFCTVEDNEILRTFLATVLDVQSIQDLFRQPPDQYWILRVEEEWSHADAFKMAEEVVAAVGYESGRIQLDGYDFSLYTLVRVSGLGSCSPDLDKLGNFDEILSVEELQDGSWELPVQKSYLPALTEKLCKVVPDCIIERDYDPTKPNTQEVQSCGYETARAQRTATFDDRVKRMIREAWPKAAAFYADLATTVGSEMNEWGKVVDESTDESWVMVETPQLQFPVS